MILIINYFVLIQSPRVVVAPEPQSPKYSRGLRVKHAMTGFRDRATEYVHYSLELTTHELLNDVAL